MEIKINELPPVKLYFEIKIFQNLTFGLSLDGVLSEARNNCQNLNFKIKQEG